MVAIVIAAATSLYFAAARVIALREAHLYIRELKATLIAQATMDGKVLSGEYLSATPTADRDRYTADVATLADGLLTKAPAQDKSQQSTSGFLTRLKARARGLFASSSSKEKLPAKPQDGQESAGATESQSQASEFPSEARSLTSQSNPVKASPTVSASVPLQPLPTAAVAEGEEGELEPDERDDEAAAGVSALPTGKEFVSFINVSLVDAGPGKSVLNFGLLNPNQSIIKRLSGRVCAMAHVDVERGEIRQVSSPPNLVIGPNNLPQGGCRGGSLVRFSRYRPTEITLPTSLGTIRKVLIFFAESETGKVQSHTFEHSNNL